MRMLTVSCVCTQVCSMRVPVPLLTPHLATIIEGVLLWAEDTKNRFKLKVRHLVERLIKRCGMDAVAAVFPEQVCGSPVHA